jgi:predicted lipase
MKNTLKCLVLLLFISIGSKAQSWKPGFDKQEYIELLKVNAMFGDSTFRKNVPTPSHSKFLYRSAVVGLENRWDLYLRDDNVAIISIRGTTASKESWMANFYSAMVPAIGFLQLSKTDTFRYHLADNPKAAVHIGWLISTAYLSPSIVTKIDSLYKAGIKRFIITGHSQGGAIAYLLTAHLYDLRNKNIIPKDIEFKTYCSAGPKPGNLYFAYDYEHETQGGWAFNVVNTADWVPETPVTIQT